MPFVNDDPPTSGEPHDPFAHDPFAGMQGSQGSQGIPFFGDLMRTLQGASGGQGTQTRDVARAVATGTESEPNIDPSERITVEQLMRVAELQVADVTALDTTHGSALKVDVVNRIQWADRTIRDYDALLTALGESITSATESPEEASATNPLTAMLSDINRMLRPLMLSLTTGTLVGQLAQRALGGYVLPVPRPADAAVLVVLPNVDAFGSEWSLDVDDLRMWVCLHEAVYHAVFGVTHVRERIWGLLQRHAAAFECDPHRLEKLLQDFDPGDADPEGWTRLQAAIGRPETLLGAVRSTTQEHIRPELTALLATVSGYVDHTMDRVGSKLIGSYDKLSEALRRHRATAVSADQFGEKLLGIELDQAQYNRGAAFAAGVVERAGHDGLQRLFTDPANLPTPNEVDAAGLWLARIDLPR